MIKYGVIIGRMQPPHKGHQAIIDEIIMDGLTPIVIVGGCNKDDARHPFHYYDVSSMLEELYEDIMVVPISDYTNWDTWLDAITEILPTDTTIYTNDKPQDVTNFTLRGKDYTDAFYNDIWKDIGIPTKQVTAPYKLGLQHINATAIREDLEANKWALDPKVYNYIKGLQC